MKQLKDSYLKDLFNSLEDTVNFEKLRNSRILITGATGLIGGFLTDMLIYADELMNAGIEIYALGRNRQKLEERFLYAGPSMPSFLVQDVCEPVRWPDGGLDYIIHAAGDGYPEAFRIRPVETMLPAIVGTKNVLELARNCSSKGFVFISSGEVYGNRPGNAVPFKETDPVTAQGGSVRSCYPVGKQAGEILTLSYAAEYRVNAKAARLGHTYGAYTAESDNRASTQFLRLAATGQDIELYSKGGQVRSYTYIADAASAILTILINGKSGEVYNVASFDQAISIAEFADKLAEMAEVGCRFVIPDEDRANEATPISYAVLDPEKVKGLGWKSRYNITEGLRSALDNMK